MNPRLSLESKLASATRDYDFTFTLPAGVTISSASTTATVYSGTDASPSSIIDGSAAISGAVVTQSIIAGTAGVLYTLLCSATCSDGQVLTLEGVLAVL
jgi:hypothetical protein